MWLSSELELPVDQKRNGMPVRGKSLRKDRRQDVCHSYLE